MNIQKVHEIKIMLSIKLIFHHQVRQERVIFLFSSRNKKNKWKMRAKLTSFFLQKQKGNVWEWEMSTICEKTKRQW